MEEADGPLARATKVRVFVADQWPVVCEGWTRMLERQVDLECCGVAQGLAQVREGVALTSPNLLVTDVRLGRDDTVAFIKHIRAELPAVKILVVTDLDPELYAVRALAAGASGFALKSERPDSLLAAVRACAAGDVYLNAKFAALLIRGPVNGSARGRDRTVQLLSDRELEVFRAIGDGMSTKQIAKALGLSTKTIDTYRTTIKRKLGLSDAAALMRSAMRWTLTLS